MLLLRLLGLLCLLGLTYLIGHIRLLLASVPTPTRGTEVRHPIFARVFHVLSRAGEAAGQPAHRAEALAGLSGRVIEVGAGNGLNFAHYPEAVSEVVAVEPESYLRDRARQAAARAPVPVRVVEGVADALPAGPHVLGLARRT